MYPGKAYNLASSNCLRCMHPALAFNAKFGFDPIWGVMSCILKWKGKDFPSTMDISKDKGVVETKSYYPTFAHVKESCKACFRKEAKLHTYENTSKSIFWKPFEKHFWKIFLSFENSLLGYSKSNFKRKPWRLMPISMFLKANVQRFGSYQKL